MYIQKRIKKLETQRNNLEYEIQDIEYEENSEKIKIFSDVQQRVYGISDSSRETKRHYRILLRRKVRSRS